MGGEQTRVEVEICGERYVIKGEGTPEQVRRVAQHVHQRMKENLARNPRLSLTKAALLTAVNITDDFLKLKADYDNLVKLLEPRENQ